MSWFSSFFPPKSSSPPQVRQAPEEEIQPPRAPSINKSVVPESNLVSDQAELPRDVRSNRNKAIFGAGIAFFAFSILITRRAFVRRRLASSPAFYSNAPGHHAEQSKKVSSAMEALEALNLATINVLSVAMVATGGTLWYLDVNSIADARKLLRGGFGVDGTGKTEEQAEEEIEEWMATVLARKEARAGPPVKSINERGQQR